MEHPEHIEMSASDAHTLVRTLHEQYGRVLLELHLHQYARAQQATLDLEIEAGASVCRELREGFDEGRYSTEHMDNVHCELELVLEAWDELIALAEPHWRETTLDRRALEDGLWSFEPNEETLADYVSGRLVPRLQDAARGGAVQAAGPSGLP